MAACTTKTRQGIVRLDKCKEKSGVEGKNRAGVLLKVLKKQEKNSKTTPVCWENSFFNPCICYFSTGKGQDCEKCCWVFLGLKMHLKYYIWHLWRWLQSIKIVHTQIRKWHYFPNRTPSTETQFLLSNTQWQHWIKTHTIINFHFWLSLSEQFLIYCALKWFCELREKHPEWQSLFHGSRITSWTDLWLFQSSKEREKTSFLPLRNAQVWKNTFLQNEDVCSALTELPLLHYPPALLNSLWPPEGKRVANQNIKHILGWNESKGCFLRTRSCRRVGSKGLLSPAQQNHHGVSLGWDEAEEENVPTAAVVTFQDSLSQRSILVQSHLFALGSHQVIHNVAASKQHRFIAISQLNHT